MTKPYNADCALTADLPLVYCAVYNELIPVQLLSKFLLMPAAYAALAITVSACGQSGPLRPAEPESAAEEAVLNESVEEVTAADEGAETP